MALSSMGFMGREFQSTHPRGVRQDEASAIIDVLQFQSTHPRGVRLMEERTTAYDELQFQSTHPRGVRRGHVAALQAFLLGFNPRTRVGCDANCVTIGYGTNLVSIHAPAWGATSRFFETSAYEKVSIHAPAWGATQ